MEKIYGQTNVRNTNSGSHLAQRLVGVFFGIIELILVLRMVLKLLGANSANVLIQGLYDVTQPLVGIFTSIFEQKNVNITETVGTFEPETLIAIVVVALIAMIVQKLIKPRTM